VLGLLRSDLYFIQTTLIEGKQTLTNSSHSHIPLIHPPHIRLHSCQYTTSHTSDTPQFVAGSVTGAAHALVSSHA